MALNMTIQLFRSCLIRLEFIMYPSRWSNHCV